MPNVLEVQIIGDVSALEKSLKQAESLQAEYTKKVEATSKELAANIAITANYRKAIDDLGKSYKSGALSSKEYSSQLAKLNRDEKESVVVTNDLREEITNLKKEQKDLGGTFASSGKKVTDGGNALMQFSRIAQDAPYGIQGIGNNITATVEAFGHLQKSTGSTGAALKAVAGSMLGSGGILLAVSLVTTGLTYMAQKGLSVEDVFQQLTGTFDESAKALSDINKEAAKTAGEEIATIKGLVSAASDVTLSTEKRLLAVKKLQEEYPAYFGNLTKEQILNGDVATAVDSVSKALIARSRASAIAGKLGENAAKRLELEEQREAAILKIKEKQSKAAVALNKKGGGNLLTPGAGVSSQSDLAIKELQNVEFEYKQIQKEIAVLDAQTKKLAETQAQATKDSIGLLETQTEAEKRAAKAKADAAKKGKIDVTPKVTALPKLETTAEVAERYLKAFREQFKGQLDQKPIPVELDIKPVILPPAKFIDKDLLDRLDVLSKKYKDMAGEDIVLPDVITDGFVNSLDRALQAADIFSQGTSSAVGALANDLTSSLETGNAALDAFVGSVIQGLAEVAAAQIAGLIAKQAVAGVSLTTDAAMATGNAVVAATETASSTGPAAAFILPALIGAAVGFVAAAFSGIKFAHGGIVPGGSFTGDKIPAMLNSGEAVMNQQQQANTLMAIANGNSNALQSNRKSSTFNLETKLRGSDILLALKREEKSR